MYMINTANSLSHFLGVSKLLAVWFEFRHSHTRWARSLCCLWYLLAFAREEEMKLQTIYLVKTHYGSCLVTWELVNPKTTLLSEIVEPMVALFQHTVFLRRSSFKRQRTYLKNLCQCQNVACQKMLSSRNYHVFVCFVVGGVFFLFLFFFGFFHFFMLTY